eukprot:SAG31_NODE_3538_length_4145_cov_1.703658_8_plen_209_part_00
MPGLISATNLCLQFPNVFTLRLHAGVRRIPSNTTIKLLRDPAKPKRGRTAYLIFIAENRQRILQEYFAEKPGGYAGAGFKARSQVVAQAWKNISPDRKARYEEQAQAERYECVSIRDTQSGLLWSTLNRHAICYSTLMRTFTRLALCIQRGVQGSDEGLHAHGRVCRGPVSCFAAATSDEGVVSCPRAHTISYSDCAASFDGRRWVQR